MDSEHIFTQSAPLRHKNKKRSIFFGGDTGPSSDLKQLPLCRHEFSLFLEIIYFSQICIIVFKLYLVKYKLIIIYIIYIIIKCYNEWN